MSAVFNPTADMPTGWVVMGPVDQSTLFIPNILSEEANCVSDVNVVDPGCEVDVVLDEDSFS